MAAPLVWASLYVYDKHSIDVSWVLAAPMLFVMVVLIRPILEEIVFRGLLQGWLIKQRRWESKIVHISYANIITSLIFAALHLLAHPPIMALLVLLPSIIFGYFRDRYHGWLIPSVILHSYFNLGYYLLYKLSL